VVGVRSLTTRRETREQIRPIVEMNLMRGGQFTSRERRNERPGRQVDSSEGERRPGGSARIRSFGNGNGARLPETLGGQLGDELRPRRERGRPTNRYGSHAGDEYI